VVISLLSQAFVTWNLVNHNKFATASHAFLICYTSKFANCMHKRGRVVCQELLTGVSQWPWDSLSVTENFFGNLIGDAPSAAVVAFINSSECHECFLSHICPFGCGVENTNATSLFSYGSEWGGPLLMVVALPNVTRNGTYQVEELVMIMDIRTSACIPTMKESPPMIPVTTNSALEIHAYGL